MTARSAYDRAKADWEKAQAARARAETEAGFLDLVAPADGIVIRRDGEIGQLINANQSVFWLSCCAPLRISTEVDEEDIAQVRVGQQVLIRSDAFPGEVFHGQVHAITPKGDPVARTYRVRVSLPQDTPLMIGMTAETNIVLRQADNALAAAGRRGAAGHGLAGRGRQLASRQVTIGAKGATEVEILSGVAEKDVVVATPPAGLKAGRSVRPVAAAPATQAMIGVVPAIALKHLLARPRQSLVSLSGIVLGVAFFLAVSSLMQGSEADFIRRLVDNSPHITVADEFRNPRRQPVEQLYAGGAVEIRSVKPLTETRGIRGFPQILEGLRNSAELRASAVLVGQAIISFAGRDVALSLNGMIPAEVGDVTTIRNYMTAGSIDELTANPDGIILGDNLVRKLALSLGENVTVTAPTGETRTFKIVGLFHTGRADYDDKQAFADLKRVQALHEAPQPRQFADRQARRPAPRAIDRRRYRAALRLQKRLVAGSQRRPDEHAGDPQHHHVHGRQRGADRRRVRHLQRHLDGRARKAARHRDPEIDGFSRPRHPPHLPDPGLPAGAGRQRHRAAVRRGLMWALMQVEFKYPGGSDPVPLPIDWSWQQFAIAAAFAMGAALCAGFLPARKGARVQPVDILRGVQ